MLERRGAGAAPDSLARDMLEGFYDVCMRAGLDGVLVALEEAFGPLEIVDGSVLAEEPRLRAGLAARLGNRAEFDPGGPRNAMPAQVAACVVAELSLTPTDPPDRTITLGDEVRGEAAAAIASVVDVALGAEIRASILAAARERCEPHHLEAFDRLSAHVDERGMRLPPQRKVPLDAVQAVQRAIVAGRIAVVERAAAAAIDRAAPVLARVSPEAAARIDQPITHRLTPRDVAVRRAAEVSNPRPEAVAASLLASLAELAGLAWLPREMPVRAYSPFETFAVGDVIDHSKFGRGTVQVATAKNVEVEFPDGKYTLVHARPR